MCPASAALQVYGAFGSLAIRSMDRLGSMMDASPLGVSLHEDFPFLVDGFYLSKELCHRQAVGRGFLDPDSFFSESRRVRLIL